MSEMQYSVGLTRADLVLIEALLNSNWTDHSEAERATYDKIEQALALANQAEGFPPLR